MFVVLLEEAVVLAGTDYVAGIAIAYSTAILNEKVVAKLPSERVPETW